jgi:ribosomal protein L24E
MFLHIVGHNQRFRVIHQNWRKFIETMHRYFKEVLYAIGELRQDMIKAPSNDTPAGTKHMLKWMASRDLATKIQVMRGSFSSILCVGVRTRGGPKPTSKCCVSLSWMVMQGEHTGVYPGSGKRRPYVQREGRSLYFLASKCSCSGYKHAREGVEPKSQREEKETRVVA